MTQPKEDNFQALLLEKTTGVQTCRFVRLSEADLMPGDVTVRVTHSSLNYKDALAITDKAPIAKRYPLIPGIDLAGKIISSQHNDWQVGDEVMVNGWGIGESHHGGYAEKARLKAEWLSRPPQGWGSWQTMAVGVAGFTAMLCLAALEEQGLRPDQGPVLVTGAAGGVGAYAVLLLARAGFHVVAATGRLAERDFLSQLGAAEIIDRAELNGPVKTLAKARWQGAIDSVGSVTLANILSQLQDNGVVAACGLAQGMDLPTSVAPFILRGAKLIGINSVTVPQTKRARIWQRLSQTLTGADFSKIITEASWQDLPTLAQEMMAGKIRGRILLTLPPA